MSEVTFIPHVEIINGNIRTTSLKVAEHFGKRHDTVLRAIKQLDCSEEFTAHNFAVSEYRDSSGKANLFYEMTRDGFTFVAMGFTGKEAAKWKEAYITAFNRMEAELLSQARQSAIKALESPTLTASDQQTLSEIVDHRARECANIGKAKAEIWSRIHRKFRVARYQQLPREQLSAAITYVMQMDLKTEAAPAMPVPEKAAYRDIADYTYAREQMSSLYDWSRRALPPRVQDEVYDVLKELDRSLVRGWTEIDESLICLIKAMGMLRRWKRAH